MYIPASFRETDPIKLHDLMDRYGFAQVITSSPAGLVASHVPVLIDSTQGKSGTLLGHFARANNQTHDFGSESLVIFSGPHAYVSPTWYATPNTVPTWNYVAVHAYGILEPVEDRHELSQILQMTVKKYEGHRPEPWGFDSETDFHQKLMEAIVGFRIEITRLEGKWKLNQNHPPERRQRVIDALREAGGEDRQAIASLMSGEVHPTE